MSIDEDANFKNKSKLRGDDQDEQNDSEISEDEVSLD